MKLYRSSVICILLNLGWNSHWIEAVLAWTWIWLPEFSWVHFHGPKRRFYVCKLRWTHFFELSKWWGIHSFFYLGGKAKHSLLDSSSSSSIGGVPTTAPPQSSGSISIFHLYQIENSYHKQHPCAYTWPKRWLWLAPRTNFQWVDFTLW